MNRKVYSRKPWYSNYWAMMYRCYNTKASNYMNYGGRGICVCEEWHDIECFNEWVESSNYEEGLTLDRIDVHGDYCPKNCRWATRKQQANNRRNTVYIEWCGEKHTLSEWSEILGISIRTLSSRYHRGDRGDRLFEMIRKKGNPNTKVPIRCVELSMDFESIKEASKYTNCASTSIIHALRGEMKSAGGYHWEYLNKVEAEVE